MRHPPLTLCLLLLLSTAARAEDAKPALPSTEDAQVANLADAKWRPAPAPNEKVLNAPIAVDPASKGSIGYTKLPAGYRLAAHWHSATEYTAVLSGHAIFTLDGKEHAMDAGSYIVIPPKSVHALVCGAGAECVLLTRRGGATDYHWVDAK